VASDYNAAFSEIKNAVLQNEESCVAHHVVVVIKHQRHVSHAPSLYPPRKYSQYQRRDDNDTSQGVVVASDYNAAFSEIKNAVLQNEDLDEYSQYQRSVARYSRALSI
jgi:hypothetical protein